MVSAWPDVLATGFCDEVDGVHNDGVVMELMGHTCVVLKPVGQLVDALADSCPLLNPETED